MKAIKVEEASSLLQRSPDARKRLEAASTLGFQWGQLYDMFSKADTLGSLINPQRFFGSGLMTDEQLEQISEALSTIIVDDRNATDEQQELAAAAQGLTRATELLSGRYTLVITNVPYLGRGKQNDELKKYLDTQYALGKADLATAFVLRCLEFCTQGGSTALVTPQNWLFLTTYKKLRETLLERRQWDFVARLGHSAFETIGGQVVNVSLLGLTANEAGDDQQMAGIDVAAAKEPREKADQLCGQQQAQVVLIPQRQQLDNPDAKFSMSRAGQSALLSEFAGAPRGVVTGDNEFWVKQLWELPQVAGDWRYLQTSIDDSLLYTGRSKAINWSTLGVGMLRPGLANTSYGKRGIAVSQIGDLPCTIYSGELYDNASFAIVPSDESMLPALAAFCFDPVYHDAVRHFNQKLSVDPSHLINIPFDLKHWQKVAAEKYPNGLPEPESDDPTQWLFHGWPVEAASSRFLASRPKVKVASSRLSDKNKSQDGSSTLQVAVARLLGYRWPAELDSKMRLSQRARALVARCDSLDEFVDDDGIVCIPSVRGEDPASDRLLRLLNACGESSIPTGSQPLAGGQRSATTGNDNAVTDSIPEGSQPGALSSLRDEGDDGDGLDPVVTLRLPPANGSNPYGVKFSDLDVYLRDRFFQEHCELFHQRPFIWHIWDGRKDGFSAQVNYHKLAGPQGKKLLENLTYSYLGDWITRQEAGVKNNESGADDRLLAAKELQDKLQAILQGKPPYDIFVRWKPLHEQPIGWTPDINDGVRMNIRPFMLAELSRGRRGAGVLRYPPKIKWTKDRGKEPKRPIDDYPWFWD